MVKIENSGGWVGPSVRHYTFDNWDDATIKLLRMGVLWEEEINTLRTKGRIDAGDTGVWWVQLQ